MLEEKAPEFSVESEGAPEEPTREQAEKDKGNTQAKPDRGTIGFPYVHLEEALTVSQAMHNHGGVACSRDQLATAVGQKPGSGSFSLKVGAARLFGLVESVDGRYQLTAVGAAAASGDDASVRAARAKAFLNVPLYRKVYDEFKGKPLPPRPKGLENAFLSFGVPSKQTDKARQAFDRSAQFAGFFGGGRDRLIEPIVGPMSKASEVLQKVREAEEGASADAARHKASDATREPLIHGLLIRLPEPGTEWNHTKRVQWLKLCASVLDMVYTTTDSEIGYIDVEFKPL